MPAIADPPCRPCLDRKEGPAPVAVCTEPHGHPGEHRTAYGVRWGEPDGAGRPTVVEELKAKTKERRELRATAFDELRATADAHDYDAVREAIRALCPLYEISLNDGLNLEGFNLASGIRGRMIGDSGGSTG